MLQIVTRYYFYIWLVLVPATWVGLVLLVVWLIEKFSREDS